jgi:hypothetical protein
MPRGKDATPRRRQEMAIHQRKGALLPWGSDIHLRSNQFGDKRPSIPSRILDSCTRLVRRCANTMGRQAISSESVRKWAHKNAYTLIFLSALFFVTWVVEIVVEVFS